ncbi:MAG: AMP-binding protein [Segniliparus sp.]|uniref:AMP-binding protein n=1 Tax=Segniliparus sp. TaxID=2804064 RepID=UPI003F2A96AB
MDMLHWLDEPSSREGVHFAQDDPAEGWVFASYAELAADVFRVAGLLQRRGLERGDVVSILAFDPRDFLLAFYGTLVAGGTPSPIATPLTFRSFDVYTRHLADVLAGAGPKAFLVDRQLVGVAEQAAAVTGAAAAVVPFGASDLAEQAPSERRDAADLALLQFTSGSSGTPKGVRVTGENLEANIASISSWLGVTSADSLVSWLPHYHDMGLIGGLLTPIAHGLEIRLLTPAHFVRSPLRWLESLGKGGGTVAVAPSFGYSYAARRIRPDQVEGLDFSRWRVALAAAERVDPAGLASFVELAAPHGFDPRSITVAYGLAEATLAVTGTRPGQPVRLVQLEHCALREGEPVAAAHEALLGEPVPGGGNWIVSCGKPVEGTTVEIVDEHGAVLDDGQHGQIRVRGAGVASGYKAAPHAQTSTSFLGGELSTGDTGFLLDGELYVIGRMGDSIKVRGVKLFAEDLDARIGAVTGLSPGKHATILGTAGGVDVVATIVESADSSWLAAVKSAVLSVVSENVAIAVFRGDPGAIERTSSGKPRRRVLWRRLLDGDLPVEAVHSNWAELSEEPAPWALTAPASAA